MEDGCDPDGQALPRPKDVSATKIAKIAVRNYNVVT
jgi:hypothetical protein